MDDATLVCGRQTARDLDCQLQRPFRRQRPTLGEAPPQRVSLKQLGDDELDVAFAAHVEYREDVGMGERGHGAGFALEAIADHGIGGDTAQDDLDRDIAPKAGVPSAIDLSHAAGAQRRHNLIRAEARAGSERHAGTGASSIRRTPLAGTKLGTSHRSHRSTLSSGHRVPSTSARSIH